MELKSTLFKLPFTLFLLVLLILFLPPFSVVLMGGPWVPYFSQSDFFETILVTSAYWLVPSILCFLILARRLSFIPLFVAEVCLLLVHSLAAGKTHPNEMLLIRYYVLTLMGFSTLAFVNRDILFPFIVEARRGWRVNARTRLKKECRFYFTDHPEKKVKIELENISVSGIALLGDMGFAHIIHEKDQVPNFLFQLEIEGTPWLLHARIVHTRPVGELLYVGLEVLNTDTLGRMFDSLVPQAQPRRRWELILARKWTRTDFRLVAGAVWVLLLLSIFFATPSFDEVRSPSSSNSTSVVTFE